MHTRIERGVAPIGGAAADGLEVRLKDVTHRAGHLAPTDRADRVADAPQEGAGGSESSVLHMTKPLVLVLAALLSLAACSSDATGNGSSSSDVDRSGVEEVEVAMITALLESDFDTVRILVLPDQREVVDSLEQVAELSPSPDPEIVSVEATVIEEDGATAIVDYSGEYCLPESTTEVQVTAVGSNREEPETIPGSSFVVTEPEQCFDLDEIFQTDHVELQLIDGEWYAPLPE